MFAWLDLNLVQSRDDWVLQKRDSTEFAAGNFLHVGVVVGVVVGALCGALCGAL